MFNIATAVQKQMTDNSINEWARYATIKLYLQKADLHLLTHDPDGKDWSCVDNLLVAKQWECKIFILFFYVL